MTIPITIVGNRFAQVWEERRTATVVLAIQKGMIEQGMRPTDLVVKFVEECPSSDGNMDFEEFVHTLAALKLRLPLAEVRAPTQSHKRWTLVPPEVASRLTLRHA